MIKQLHVQNEVEMQGIKLKLPKIFLSHIEGYESFIANETPSRKLHFL